MAFQPSREHPVLPRFERVQLVYKTLHGVDFEVGVLIPKSIASSTRPISCPLLAHFHGGGLLMGTILDKEILAVWPLEFAEAQSAIVVSPAYRLLPEANGTDVLDDVKDFWAWVRGKLPGEIAALWPHVSLDINRTAVSGESAGGYLSLQSALLYPEAGIKVVMAQYPSLFMDLDWLPRPSNPPAESQAIVDTYLASLKPGAMRLLSPYWGFIQMLRAVLSSGRFPELIGDDERLSLAYGLRNVKNLPPIWIAQGTDDVLIPKAATDEVVDRIRKSHPDTPILYSVQPGPHGFDKDHTLKEPWVMEGIKFANKYW